ncbi:MAG TPA: sigma-70 family RNA polymerase sigma factor [Candidatus Acidoferrum sp.]|nr:sigma-70 family RNA polymerase sigma factor [Candidatus Acidoferrum sp.]
MSDWASALSWGGGEAELVHELQAGSETAFDWLVTHYHAPVYSLILSMLGDTSDAADGTQEVFLKAFRGIRQFRQGSSLKTWLYRIAIREALNQKRWFKRHLQKNVSIDAEPEEGQARFEIPDHGGTPFEQLAAHEIQDAVQGALQKVPEAFRSAVILRDLEGLSYEEVAEVLECSVGTVKSRILRGRRALKDILEPMLAEPMLNEPKSSEPKTERKPSANASAPETSLGHVPAHVQAFGQGRVVQEVVQAKVVMPQPSPCGETSSAAGHVSVASSIASSSKSPREAYAGEGLS